MANWSALALASSTVPALIVSPPRKAPLFAPLMVNVPLPTFVNVPPPMKLPDRVELLPLVSKLPLPNMITDLAVLMPPLAAWRVAGYMVLRPRPMLSKKIPLVVSAPLILAVAALMVPASI